VVLYIILDRNPPQETIEKIRGSPGQVEVIEGQFSVFFFKNKNEGKLPCHIASVNWARYDNGRVETIF
jgi:hypothetical protein